MQKLYRDLLFQTGVLLMGLMGSSALFSATEPGFRDRLGVYPSKTVVEADSTIKELSRKYGVAVAFESGGDFAGPIDPLAILVRLSLEDGFKAQVAVGESIVNRGIFSTEEGKKLSHVMNAYIKETLSDSAIFAGIQFLQNSFDQRVNGKSQSFAWERWVLTVLVGSFLFLSVLIFLLDRRETNSSASAHHLF